MITTLYCLSERQPLHRLCSLYVELMCVCVRVCIHEIWLCVCVCVFACKFFSQLFSSFLDGEEFRMWMCVRACLRCVVLLSKYIAIIQQHLCAFSFVSLHFACRIRPKNVSCELFKRIRKFLLCNYRMMCWQKRMKWTQNKISAGKSRVGKRRT